MTVQEVPLTKLQLRVATIPPALDVATALSQIDASPASHRALRARTLGAAARARVGNAMLRGGSIAIVTLIAVALLGNWWPVLWYAVLIGVLFCDRAIFQRLRAQCEAGAPPEKIPWLFTWVVAQSIYGNIIAAMFWYAPYVPGETLAVMYLAGGLANAAATLRSSAALSIAGAGPTVLFMLGLPLSDYLLGGARNPLELTPMVAAFLLLAFGVNLWKSLLASDVAQAQAEAAALRERQAAAAAAAAKSDMIRRMNDELRTPMAALIGAAEHLRRAAATPQARAHIAMLAQAGEVLKLVLDDLSDLDRLENGELRIETKPTDPREIARGVVSAFRTSAHDKQIELFLDVEAATPACVEIDPLRVRQILFNLLANAVRYTTHGGVRVRVGAQPGEQDGHVALSFSIVDTGCGMSRSQLAMVFGRERLSVSGEGPGLGLAISLRLARLMGGRLTAKSELGEGSAFTLTLEAPVLTQAERGAA